MMALGSGTAFKASDDVKMPPAIGFITSFAPEPIVSAPDDLELVVKSHVATETKPAPLIPSIATTPLLKINVPPLMEVTPLYVSLPDRVNVPLPALVNILHFLKKWSS
jgi:hypothetical protein